MTKSPTLNGRRNTRNAPAAKLASRPPHATPMATPPAAISAAKVVVSTPKNPRIATTSAMLRTTDEAGLQIARERGVEFLARERGGHQAQRETNQPLACQPQDGRTRYFPGSGRQCGDCRLCQSIDVHESSFSRRQFYRAGLPTRAIT